MVVAGYLTPLQQPGEDSWCAVCVHKEFKMAWFECISSFKFTNVNAHVFSHTIMQAQPSVYVTTRVRMRPPECLQQALA